MSYEPTVWVDGDHVTSAKLNKLEQGVNSMSYTPTVWNAGDVVTAEKLNKLEQGVADSGGGGATIPTVTTSNDGTYTCDVGYDGWHSLIENSIYEKLGSKVYPTWVLSPPPPGVPGGLAGAFFSSNLDDNGISVAVDEQTRFIFHDDGTFEITE